MMARARLRRFAVPFLFSILVVAAESRDAHAADVTITDEARARFSAGVNLLKDPEGPRYEEAYREFKAAYAASPSYKILGNLGLCAMKLERDDEAIIAFEKYLEEAKDLSPAEVAQVKADLHTLKVGVAHVTITSDPPGAQILDSRLPVRGERVSNSYGPINAPTKLGIRQGQHTLTARLAGYPDVVWEVDASSGELGEHTFEFKKAVVAEQPAATRPAPETAPPPAEKARPIPTTVYIGAAATGALAVGTIVTGILATSKRSEYDTKNDGRDPAAAQSLKDSGQTMSLVSDVCLGGAVIAAGLTAYFYFGRPTVEVPARAARRAPVPTIAWTPELRPGGGGFSVAGQF